jgi:predicted PurR-regulated permease PerM
MDHEPIRPARLLGLLALLALGTGCLLVLWPFLSALIWAAIIVFSTWPAFVALRDRLGLTPGWAAAVMVAAVMLLVGLPVVLAAPTTREEITSLQHGAERLLTEGLPNFYLWLLALPMVGGWLRDWLGETPPDLFGIAGLLRPYAGTLAQSGLSLLLAVLSGVAELLVAIFLSFFIYRDGEAMAAHAHTLAGRLAGPQAQRLFHLTGDVTRGVIYGLIGTGIVQGAMTAFGCWIAGVPQPLLLGVVTGVISLLPVGAPLVWLPAAIWLFTEGQTGWGIFMLVYGAGGISSVDNIIRPWMISLGADLPLLLTLLGAVGGVLAFGFLGLVLGPVLLAVGFSLVKDFAEHPPGLPEEVAGSPSPPPAGTV